MVVFFFKQKTAYEMRISDWSSDVCSSDLLSLEVGAVPVVDPVGDAAVDRPGPGHAADGGGQGGAVGRCPGEAHGVGHGGALTAHDEVLDLVAQAAELLEEARQALPVGGATAQAAAERRGVLVDEVVGHEVDGAGRVPGVDRVEVGEADRARPRLRGPAATSVAQGRGAAVGEDQGG